MEEETKIEEVTEVKKEEKATVEQTYLQQMLIAEAARLEKRYKKHPEERNAVVICSKGTYHADAKPGRNDKCPCGSGKKYKNCCGNVNSVSEK